MFDRSRSPSVSASGLQIGLVVSTYHMAITTALREGAVAAFQDAGGHLDQLVVVEAPGAFELTAMCLALATRADLDGIVALGCIVAGETTHDQHLAQAVAGGLTSIIVQTGVPIAFGVLTCQTLAQAEARAGGLKGNKGAEAMQAVIQTVRTIRDVGVKCRAEPGSRPGASTGNGQEGSPRRRLAEPRSASGR